MGANAPTRMGAWVQKCTHGKWTHAEARVVYRAIKNYVLTTIHGQDIPHFAGFCHLACFPVKRLKLQQLGKLAQTYTSWFGKEHNSERENQRYDKNTVCLLGQEISVKQKTLKIRHFEDLSNGFTPRLHLLRWTTRWDESTLRYAGCFLAVIWKKRY